MIRCTSKDTTEDGYEVHTPLEMGVYCQACLVDFLETRIARLEFGYIGLILHFKLNTKIEDRRLRHAVNRRIEPTLEARLAKCIVSVYSQLIVERKH